LGELRGLHRHEMATRREDQADEPGAIASLNDHLKVAVPGLLLGEARDLLGEPTARRLENQRGTRFVARIVIGRGLLRPA